MPPGGHDADPISADRPDLTDSTDVVGAGRWQIESGLSFDADRDGGISQRAIAAPLAMLRLGIGSQFEARLSADGLVSDSVSVSGRRTRTTGRSDVQLGAKWRVFDRPWRCLAVALEPVVSLPAGSAAFTSAGYDPTVKVIVDASLPRGLSLSANFVVSAPTEDHHRFAERDVSGSLGYPIGSRWSGFAELFRASSLARGGPSAWILDAGAARPIGTRAQLDVIGGVGLSAAAPDWFIGAGFALRGAFRR